MASAGLHINEIDMKPARSGFPRGVIATAPLRTGNLVKGLQQGGSGFVLQNQEIAIVRSDAECASAMDNPQTATNGVGSGRMVAVGQDGSLSGSSGLDGLYVGIWQVCFRAVPQGSFVTTGVSIRLQVSCVCFRLQISSYFLSAFVSALFQH